MIQSRVTDHILSYILDSFYINERNKKISSQHKPLSYKYESNLFTGTKKTELKKNDRPYQRERVQESDPIEQKVQTRIYGGKSLRKGLERFNQIQDVYIQR